MHENAYFWFMSEHALERHNKTLLMYHLVLPLKYRRKAITALDDDLGRMADRSKSNPELVVKMLEELNKWLLEPGTFFPVTDPDYQE
jgi:hypothetical protein